jgi:uncharacterized protein DUF3379
MNCEAARLLIGAQPGADTAQLEEHLQGCAACRTFREEMRTLDADIRRALELAPQAARTPRRLRAPWRRWALAASVLVAMAAVLGLWLLRPSDTLARAVVAHVQAEPESWLDAHDVTARSIAEALNSGGVALDVTSAHITYAQSCWFRGHYVPHLVLQTTRGPATIILLRHETVSARRAFHEAGMSGVLVPAGQGSIAVLARGGDELDTLAGRMQHEVRWLPQP